MYLAMRDWSSRAVVGCYTNLKRAKKEIEREAKDISTGLRECYFRYYIVHCPPNRVAEAVVRRYTYSKGPGRGTSKRWSSGERMTVVPTPMEEFAYSVLEGDPIVCDAVKDVLKM